MPFESRKTPAVARLVVWPHRSLSPKGFATFIAITFAMLLMPLFPLLGTPVLWALLPFLMGALALVWVFLRKSYADAALRETLTIGKDRIELVRHEPRRPDRIWEANPYWVKVRLHPTGGPVENYVTLKGGGREVEIGAFLSPEERTDLHGELQKILDECRAGPAN